RARELERSDELQFLFGYEEAIGYAFGRIADDKDGIAALGVLLELVRRLHAEGRTLRDRLDELFLRHSLFATRQLTVARATGGAHQDLMARLRALDPSAFLGAGTSRIDYAREAEAVELLVFRRADGSRLCVRPSGTEPKLKLYLHAGVVVTGALDEAERAAQHTLDELEASVHSL
ncbi:MAG: putative phosphomannomutase, partial [Myxococcaceae bacterium]|nr:putative phosphomannomutase [Myxococcaceae bacterium]